MARKKKTFNYQFIDCDKSFASSVVVVCTQTKEKVKMYHKQLVRLIENKYRNNYGVFKATYIKKGNKPEENNRDENGEYNTAPEGYRQYLVSSYMFTKSVIFGMVPICLIAGVYSFYLTVIETIRIFPAQIYTLFEIWYLDKEQ